MKKIQKLAHIKNYFLSFFFLLFTFKVGFIITDDFDLKDELNCCRIATGHRNSTKLWILHWHLIIVYHRYDNRLSCLTMWRNPVFSLLLFLFPPFYQLLILSAKEVNMLNINIQLGTEEAEAFYEVPSRASQQQIQPIIVFSQTVFTTTSLHKFLLPVFRLAGDLCYTCLALLPVISVVFFLRLLWSNLDHNLPTRSSVSRC